MPQVSILVAVYNAADFLSDGLDAICAQTCADIEIILVDDGSVDTSPAVMAVYAEKDPRIRVIRHKVNLGLGATRNSGIEAATAPYLVFVDADDVLEPDYCAEMLQYADSSAADLVVCGYHVCFKDKPAANYQVTFSQYKEYSTTQYLKAVLAAETTGFSWNKLYRRALIQQHQLRFETREVLSHVEDRLFSVQYLSACNSVAFCNKPLYRYSVHGSSIVGGYQKGLLQDVLTLDKIYRLIFDGRVDFQHAINVALQKSIFSVLYNETKPGSGTKRDILRRIRTLTVNERMQFVAGVSTSQLSARRRWIVWLVGRRAAVVLWFIVLIQSRFRRL